MSRPTLVIASLAAFVAVSIPAAAGSLPLLADRAPAGSLPLPYGVNLTVYSQGQDYAVSSLSFDVPGLTFDPNVLQVDNQLDELNLKADLWLLPFLNVFAIFGSIDATTTVDFRDADLPVALDNVVIRYDGNVYGGGITLAAGGDRWFTSLTGIYTQTDLGNLNSDVSAMVVSPKVGLRQGRTAFWVGAMYQQAEEDHSGRVTVPIFGAVNFAVGLEEADPWNAQVGMTAELFPHWMLEIEGGVGNRTSASLGLTYRF